MRFTLRSKFVVFSLFSVGFSLTTLSYFSTKLVSEDKESYILEYLGATSQSALQKSVNYLERLELQLKVFGSHIHPVLRESEKRWVSEYFQSLKTPYSLNSVVVFAESKGTQGGVKGEWLPLIQLGDGAAEIQANIWSHFSVIQSAPQDGLLRLLDLTAAPEKLEKSAFLTLFGYIPDAIGRPVLAVLQVNERVFENEIQKLKIPFSARFEFQSYTQNIEKDITAATIDEQKLDILKAFSDPFLEGVRLLPKDLLLGYAKNEQRNMRVAVITNKKLVNESIWAINRQAIQIGVGLFLMVTSLMTLFAKQMTEALQRLSQASKSVSEGNFDLPEFLTLHSSKITDEVSDLSVAFRVMTQKIKELIIQTAHKARMEKELETAQLVQKSFFPKEAQNIFNLGLSIYGSCLPASECGGDWWHSYALGEKHQLVVIGDVTGHGAHAALVTAAVYAGVLSAVNSQKNIKVMEPKEFLIHLISELNEIVARAGGGHVSMSFCALIISEEQQSNHVLHYINAGHPPAYLLKGEQNTPSNPISLFTPLNQGQTGLLGTIKEKLSENNIAEVELNPNSSIFIYTDGLMETRKQDDQKMSKKQFLKMLYDSRSNFSQTESVTQVMNELLQFYGEGVDVRPDDMTLVEIRVHNKPEQVQIAA